VNFRHHGDVANHFENLNVERTQPKDHTHFD